MLACELQLSVTSLQLRESARFQLGSLIQHPTLCTMAWKLFEGSSWDNHRAHLICSSSLRDYRPTWLNIQHLEIVVWYILPFIYLFLVASSGRVNLVPVILFDYK